MGKAVQYYNGLNWQQFGVTKADITVQGVVCTFFYTVKDSLDNLYILCFTNGTGWDANIPFIRISKTGIKTVTTLYSYNDECRHSSNINLSLSRDEQSLFVTFSNSSVIGLKQIKTDMSMTSIRTTPILTAVNKFAIYQDRYIWVSVGSTVRIYDYDTKAELASVSSNVGNWDGSISIICDIGNNFYVTNYHYNSIVDEWTRLHKIVFNGTSITYTNSYLLQNYDMKIKQLLIDKWGDLIILTNSGTASTLLKYTTAGVQIGTALNLADPSYDLNTDRSGNYYYSTAINTYKITANTAQGQAFTGTGTSIRGSGSGMTTYGNNITNFNPAVFG
jgi:hypothetical protein